MIGKPEWFQRRKYGGWGLAPKTWQGWLYIIIFVLLLFTIQLLPLNFWIKLTATLFLGIILVIDTIIMMSYIAKDEREKIHEAIAERNALWAIIIVLCVGIAYQTSIATLKMQAYYIDPIIIIALFAGLLVKAITNIYLDRKD